MKAIVLNQAGGIDQLQLQDVTQPTAQKNEVIIRLQAAALNHLDIWVRQGNGAYPVAYPHILGADGAGVVSELGPDAEGVSVGDRVLIFPAISCGQCSYCRRGLDNQCELFEILGAKRRGTYAEFVAVPDQNVVPIPDSLSFEAAAAFPLAYLTAWHMLINRAKLQPKEKVLVVGASAGVAVAAIQIAKSVGATVYAATTSANKAEKLKALGVSDVFVQDETTDMHKWTHKITEGKGVDVAFEHVGPATWEKSLKSLGKYGRLVTCGATTGPTATLDLRYVFSRNLSIFGARMGTQKDFQQLSRLVFDGKIKPVIDKTFLLHEAAQAHMYMERKQQIGKILVTF